MGGEAGVLVFVGLQLRQLAPGRCCCSVPVVSEVSMGGGEAGLSITATLRPFKMVQSLCQSQQPLRDFSGSRDYPARGAWSAIP